MIVRNDNTQLIKLCQRQTPANARSAMLFTLENAAVIRYS